MGHEHANRTVRHGYKVDCSLTYEALESATFIFSIAASRTPAQEIWAERLVFDPELSFEEHVDGTTGNRFHRVQVPGTVFSVQYSAEVVCTHDLCASAPITATPPDRLPFETLPYLYPSRYCQSDQLYHLATREFGQFAPGYGQVVAICDWAHRNIDYLSGSTDERVSAHDTVISRFGACRDFAHLSIAFCRALNIPARFVSGYAHGLELPDFHAMFEAWLGDRWYLFDPTRQVSPARFVRIGTGRDATDVSFAVMFGRFSMLDMLVTCEPLDQAADPAPDLAIAPAGGPHT